MEDVQLDDDDNYYDDGNDDDDDDDDDEDLVLPVVDVVVEDVQLEAVWVFVPLELRALREGRWRVEGGGGRWRKVIQKRRKSHSEKDSDLGALEDLGEGPRSSGVYWSASFLPDLVKTPQFCRSPDFKKSNRSNKKIWRGTIIG